ncbi:MULTISPECIES: hypothetical protein [Bacillaceae]|nr:MULTISPECIES: hypothetical protein [Bacillaceae]URM34837.1 hypothetical protein LLY41_10865 [Cytobacillus firmus]
MLTIETSLKQLYPARVAGKEAMLKLPFHKHSKRPLFLRTRNPFQLGKK